MLGVVLLVGLVLVMVTGLASNAAYDPRLAGNVALQGRSLDPLDFYLFTWPTHPVWLYAVNQGVHVTLGLALIPVLLAKQWSVLPRPFTGIRPRTVSQAIEQISLLFLIGGIYFELVTGVLFIEYWFPFGFDFTAAHFYGAWVFIGALVVHVAARLPTMRAALSSRRQLLGSDGSGALQPAPVPVAKVDAAEVQVSRRLLLASVALGSALLGVQGVAQDVGGPVRRLAFLLPRSGTLNDGPNGFPVNGTFASLGLDEGALSDWRLTVAGVGGLTLRMSRDDLLAMEMHTYSLPIACREGWSTTQRWTGVRLRDLAALVAIAGPATVEQTAIDGAQAALAANQVAAESSLLALMVNGVPLSPDHGYPARVIVPAEIAMNCLKWVESLVFTPVRDA